MKKTQLLIGTAAAALLVSGTANAGTLYISQLSGANEPPPIVGSAATGVGVLILNDAETSATVTVTHNEVTANATTTVTLGHIHRAPAGVAGPVIFPFPNPTSPIGPLVWTIPAAELTNLKNGGLYAQIHTAKNPSGDIRGQLIRALFAPAATNAAQLAVANALDVSAGLNTDLDQILIAQVQASATVKAASLSDLSGNTIYAQGRHALEAVGGFEDSLFSHAEDQEGAKSTGFAGFVVGGDAFGKRDASADQAGSTTSRPYVLVGVDYGFGEGVTAGLAVGYSDAQDKFKNSLGKTTGTTKAVEGYVSAASDVLVFSAVAGLGWNKFDTTRTLASLSRTATSSHDGSAWSLGAKLSAPIKLDGNLSIAPFALFDTQHAKIDAYTETGANSAGLVVPKISDKDTAVEAGATLMVPMGSGDNVSGRLQVGWRYLLDAGRDGVATSLVGSPVAFQTFVLSPSNSTIHIAGAVTTKFTENLTGSFGYNGNISGRMSSHMLEARLTLRM